MFLLASDAYIPKTEGKGIVPDGYVAPLIPKPPLCPLDVTGIGNIIAGIKRLDIESNKLKIVS
jgi:hypothetical protein